MSAEQHEPTDACVDETPAGAYIVCGECGHVYRTKRALRSAYRLHVRPWRREPFMSDLPSWKLWRHWLFPPFAARIWFCQVCSHDF